MWAAIDVEAGIEAGVQFQCIRCKETTDIVWAGVRPDDDHQSRSISPDIYHDVTKKMGPDIYHDVTRKIDPDIYHDVTKKMGPDIYHDVTKKMGPDIYHDVTRKMGPDIYHDVTKKMGPDIYHDVTRKIDPDIYHDVTRKIDPGSDFVDSREASEKLEYSRSPGICGSISMDSDSRSGCCWQYNHTSGNHKVSRPNDCENDVLKAIESAMHHSELTCDFAQKHNISVVRIKDTTPNILRENEFENSDNGVITRPAGNPSKSTGRSLTVMSRPDREILRDMDLDTGHVASRISIHDTLLNMSGSLDMCEPVAACESQSDCLKETPNTKEKT